MSVVGIIAEYNPMHNGHIRHIAEAKRISGADKAVIVMSGSFVQRGEPACADKFTRAGWAVDGGADMVIELPEVFSLACAERFASGGVRILSKLGIVDGLSFGSECGDADKLIALSGMEPDKAALDEALKKGLSFPAALSEAVGSKLDPNDILAVEYIKAIKKHCPGMRVYPVRREGSEYDSTELDGSLSSAKAIRIALSRYSIQQKMSPAVFDGLSNALPRKELEDVCEQIKKGLFPVTTEGLSDPVLCSLRMLGAEGVKKLPEAAEGLENLFEKHSMDSCDIEEMLSKVKSKRYTMARLKRISMCALLGITAQLQERAAADDSALYARVLAVKKDSEDLLARICERSSVPVVVRSSDREGLPSLAASVERIAATAHAIHAVGRSYEKQAVPDASYRLIVR